MSQQIIMSKQEWECAEERRKYLCEQFNQEHTFCSYDGYLNFIQETAEYEPGELVCAVSSGNIIPWRGSLTEPVNHHLWRPPTAAQLADYKSQQGTNPEANKGGTFAILDGEILVEILDRYEDTNKVRVYNSKTTDVFVVTSDRLFPALPYVHDLATPEDASNLPVTTKSPDDPISSDEITKMRQSNKPEPCKIEDVVIDEYGRIGLVTIIDAPTPLNEHHTISFKTAKGNTLRAEDRYLTLATPEQVEEFYMVEIDGDRVRFYLHDGITYVYEQVLGIRRECSHLEYRFIQHYKLLVLTVNLFDEMKRPKGG